MKYSKKQIQENRQKWLDALRSGKYRQGTSYLKKYDPIKKKSYFCCLGVACELAIKDGLKIEVEKELGLMDIDKKEYNTVFRFDNKSDYLPYDVQQWLGVTESDPSIKDHNNEFYNVSILNDEKNYKFKQIADLLEDNFKKGIL